MKEIHKGSWFRTIFSHGKWYLLSSLFSKGINILILRIYTEYLNPSEYGILDSLNSVALLLPIFISLYLDSAFARYFHEYKGDSKKLMSLFSTTYWFVVVFGILIVGLTILTSSFWMPNLLEVPVYPYALLAFIPPLFIQIGNLGLIFLRQNLLSRQTTILEVSSVFVNILVALPLLIYADLGVIAKLWGNFATAVVLFSYYTVYFVRSGLLKLYFSKDIIKTCLIYSIPLIPNIAGGWIAGLSDRLVIAKYTTLEAVGLYSIGFTLGKLLYFVQDAITQVVDPVSMSGLINDKEATKLKMANTSLYLWGGMLFANFCLFLFAKEIIAIFADSTYKEAYFIIPIIGFTYVLSSQYRIFSTIISFHKKNWVISSGGIIQALLNLGLNLWLVPIYGYIAAAYTSVFSMFGYTLWLVLWSFKWDKINIDYKKYILLSILVLLAVFIVQNIEIKMFVNKLLISIITFILVLIVLDKNIIKKLSIYKKSYFILL